MEWELVNLPEIAVIGKEGLCTETENLAPSLWQQCDAHFAEVAALGMRERDGSLVGFWGAMSDETMSFQPWTNHFTRGYYLAGIEVSGDAQPPEGWTKWVLPPRAYLKVEVDMSRYLETFSHVLEREIPRRKLKLCGAVCDHTKPATGKHYLLFPVEEA